MKKRARFALVSVVFGLLMLIPPMSLAEPDEPEPLPAASVTTEALEAKIAETEASGLEEDARKKLLELYRNALGKLKTAASSAQAAEEYSRTVETAPARIEVLRKDIADLQARVPGDALEAAPSDPLSQLVQRLQKEKTDIAAVRTQRSDAENRLVEVSARPPLIRQRLTLARSQQEELATQLQITSPGRRGRGDQSGTPMGA